MELEIIKLSDILNRDNTFRMDAKFHVKYRIIHKEYMDYLKGKKPKKLSKLIKIIKTSSIKKGDLILYDTFLGRLKIEISKKDMGFLRHVYKIEVVDKSIDKYSLIYYLNEDKVKKYIHLFSRGIYGIIPIDLLLSIDIPTKKLKKKDIGEAVLVDVSIHELIFNELYGEYKFCIKNSTKLSSIALAGALCENLLIRELLNSNIKPAYINEFNGLNNLIKLAEIERILKEDEKELFNKVKKARNLIHSRKLAEEYNNNYEKIIDEGLEAFKEILEKYKIIYESEEYG
jgi:hypothetical protein